MSHSLSGKFLVREWRSGELGILLLALVLAVSVVVGVSSFVGRLQSALLSESARFLAADLVVVSRSSLQDDRVERAEAQGLTTSLSVGFPSMTVADPDHMALVSVKAVSDGYPLRGTLQWSVRARRTTTCSSLYKTQPLQYIPENATFRDVLQCFLTPASPA